MAEPRAEITVEGQEPGRFEIYDRAVIGRSEVCDIQVHDRYVSRKQLIITCSDQGCQAENIGRNPILIDGRPLESGTSALLPASCEIQAGRTRMAFRQLAPVSPPMPPEQPGAEGAAMTEEIEEQTVLLTSPVQETGPRLVITAPTGQSTTYPLEDLPITIGRAPDCRIRLEDPAVSRHHCVIEDAGGRFRLRNLSSTNPATINGKAVTEALLHSGDQIGIGPFIASFLSDRPEDKPVQTKTGLPVDPKIAAIAGAVLLVVLAAWLFFSVLLPSWQLRGRIEEARKLMTSSQPEKAVVILEGLLGRDLPPEKETRIRTMLVEAILAKADKLATSGKISEAKRSLTAFLRQYGAGPEAKPVWDQLDYLRIEHGKLLESEGRIMEALGEYAAVPEDSPYFENARSALRDLWLKYQRDYLRSQTVNQLLAEAEEHFQAGRLLAPVNQNAYAAYQAILSLDPDNEIAHQRIEEIKLHFRDQGMRAYKAGRWADAIANFEKYLLIEPQDKEIRTYLTRCRRKLSSRRRRSAKGSTTQKKKVQKLLKESGSSSTWIMKYLFEEQKGGKDSPW